jgi:hypothetical protein
MSIEWNINVSFFIDLENILRDLRQEKNYDILQIGKLAGVPLLSLPTPSCLKFCQDNHLLRCIIFEMRVFWCGEGGGKEARVAQNLYTVNKTFHSSKN